MSHFIRLVNNYGRIHTLGKQIIKHKKNVNHIPKYKLDHAFEKQHRKLEEFEKLTNKANKDWKNNQSSINEFWTGY